MKSLADRIKKKKFFFFPPPPPPRLLGFKKYFFFLKFFLVFILLFSSCVNNHVDVLFSPNRGIQEQIISRIKQTNSTIDIAIYSFTNNEIAESLKKAKNRGVAIRLIMDKDRAEKQVYTQYKFFKKNKFKVHKLGGIMHNKFIIFDGKLLMTGSYNISKNAETSNYENVVLISDKSVVKKYQKEFEKLWAKKK